MLNGSLKCPGAVFFLSSSLRGFKVIRSLYSCRKLEWVARSHHKREEDSNPPVDLPPPRGHSQVHTVCVDVSAQAI